MSLNPQQINWNTVITAITTAALLGVTTAIVGLRDTVTELRVNVTVLTNQIQQITLVNDKQAGDIRDLERSKK